MFSSNSSQVSSTANYIENVFSTYLYTGTGASLTITNNIDTTTYGGLTWIKSRSAATDHKLTDTARGVTKALISDTTGAQTTDTTGLTAFGTTGFTIGADANYNTSAATYVSWTFRKQAKFFDIVTYTGTGSNTTIAHNLGSVPGCIIIKRTDTTAAWAVYHTSLANTEYLVLNTTAAKATGATWWNSTTPTSAVFSVGTDASVNASGGTYVAYVFAHNAGGFGLTGTDNVISCGSYTGSSNTPQQITLGYEPQWVLLKKSSTIDDWYLFDNMCGMGISTGTNEILRPNTAGAAASSSNWVLPNATGFVAGSSATDTATYIYIAIRRGPMKVPTDATKVFTPTLATFSGTTVTNTGYVVDMVINKNNTAATGNNFVLDRLRGSDNNIAQATISTNNTSAEAASSGRVALTGTTTIQNGFLEQDTTANNIVWSFTRAPSFFDEVCYTGNSTPTARTHNLGAVPELMIVKRRSGSESGGVAGYWLVYAAASGNGNALFLNTTDGNNSSSVWNNTTPTATTFTVNNNYVNYSGDTYVAYLFATCTGVSKVGSYTGTGATQTIACGFGASGARFVLIKRTDTTGDWYVWDSARGMISGTDPSLLLNSNAAEVNANSIYAISTGFQIVSTAAGINASAGSYIFLSIA